MLNTGPVKLDPHLFGVVRRALYTWLLEIHNAVLNSRTCLKHAYFMLDIWTGSRGSNGGFVIRSRKDDCGTAERIHP